MIQNETQCASVHSWCCSLFSTLHRDTWLQVRNKSSSNSVRDPHLMMEWHNRAEMFGLHHEENKPLFSARHRYSVFSMTCTVKKTFVAFVTVCQAGYRGVQALNRNADSKAELVQFRWLKMPKSTYKRGLEVVRHAQAKPDNIPEGKQIQWGQAENLEFNNGRQKSKTHWETLGKGWNARLATKKHTY